MSPSNPYKRTKTACYLAYVSQAAVITLMPLLFTTLREQLGVSYTVLALLTGFNFVTQLSADFFFSSAAAKFGY
ncbi:MAG TPA: MFS transporter, partial [Clostridiales bacterium]|nr:MFS transporter [Clostridiales bacterium]